MWILTNDATDSADAGVFPLDEKVKQRLDEDFMAQYGIMAGQKKAIITDAKLKLQTVGFDVEQLQLLPQEIQDAKMIADQLNFPPYLLGLVDAKFDNQQIAERSLYTNSIIPDVVSDDEQWSEIFGLTDLGLRLYTDFNDVPALQEDMANKGKGMLYMNQALVLMFYNNLITLNRWRELANEDTVTGDDRYYHEYVAVGQSFGQVATPAPIQEDQSTGKK
jgi:phage portal protein BeeE